MASLAPGARLEQRQQQRGLLLPLLRLMAVPACQMEDVLLQEARENPAIELEEVPLCPTCRAQVTTQGCPLCRARQLLPAATTGGSFYEGRLEAPEESRREALMRSLLDAADGRHERAIRAVVESLDDFGYLRESDETIATLGRVPVEAVRRVREMLREVAPPGVGARTPLDGLLAQLDALPPSWERERARIYLETLARIPGRVDESLVTEMTGLSLEETRAARAFVVRHLKPHPLYLGRDEARPVSVDVVFFAEPGGYVAELVEWSRYRPVVSPAYLAAARQCDDAAERDHIEQALAEARLFSYRWEKGRDALRRIVGVLARCQQSLLAGREAETLSASEVAEATGLHRSTVRRAIAGRYALLPSGSVVPLESFLVTQSTVRRQAVRRVLEMSPTLTDQEVSDWLSEQGLDVPRRSVAYHRARLRLRA